MSLSEQDTARVISHEFWFLPNAIINSTSTREGYFSYEIVDKYFKILISYSPIRLEFDVDISFGNETIYISDLIGYNLLKDIHKAPEVSLYRVYQENDIASFSKLINHFAKLLEKNLGYISSHRQELLNKITEIRKKACQASSDHDLIMQANHYFRIKNWEGVVDRLEKVQSNLSELNKKRLAYCKNKIKD
ncbi:MAG: hypothetical protein A2078_15150 [Nitrospirae bacterium GWC2_57_9]|nr:MAG: hypothetical protein A2078_15150 [Nitrospirae bacterium GWC2_57_9]